MTSELSYYLSYCTGRDQIQLLLLKGYFYWMSQRMNEKRMSSEIRMILCVIYSNIRRFGIVRSGVSKTSLYLKWMKYRCFRGISFKLCSLYHPFSTIVISDITIIENVYIYLRLNPDMFKVISTHIYVCVKCIWREPVKSDTCI